METPTERTYDRVDAPFVGTDRVISDAPAYAARPAYSTYPGTLVGENVMTVRNRVQWGPILAGTVFALAMMLVLSVLGLAIGASAFGPDADTTDWGTEAGIWGGASALISLFLGGWIAAKTAAVGGSFAGLINGLMTGAATILLLLWLTTTGVTNLLGFVGGTLSDVATVVDEQVTGAEAEAAADEVTGAVTFDDVENAAWGTAIALILGLGAAAFGGYLGYNQRRDLIEGTG